MHVRLNPIAAAIPSSTTVWVAVCTFNLRRAEEQAPNINILLIVNTLHVQTAPKSTHAHPRVINNTPAMFEVNLMNVFCAMLAMDRRTHRDSLLFWKNARTENKYNHM